MAREIKFRAWHKGDKKMIYQSDYASFHWFWITPHGAVYRDGQYQDLILMQYTGLKDKNGKEIYEGDILMGDNKNVPLIPVVWDELTASFNVFYNIRAEVVGNIYENPNLLEAK